MRILALAPQPFFSFRGTPLSVYHRTRIMAELGARIDLLTYGQGDDVALPGVRIVRGPRLAWLGAVPVGPSLLKLVHDVFLALRTVTLLLTHRYDAIHAHEEAVFLARWLAPLAGCRLIYDMHSSLPQQLANFGSIHWRPVVALFDWLERSSLRRADAVITICPELGRLAEARMDDPSRHLVIENSLLDPVALATPPTAEAHDPTNSLSDVFESLAGRPLVVYAGTFEAYQGIDLLVDAFARLDQRHRNTQLVLIGGTPRQIATARRRAEETGVGHRTTTPGRLDQQTTRRWLDRATVVVSPRTKGNNTPLKIYELLALGHPLVATRVLSHTQVLDDSVAYLADPEPAALAAALALALDDTARGNDSQIKDSQINDSQIKDSRARAATRLYATRYDVDAYRAKIRRLLERVG